jgi:hypothetical protein
VRVERINIIYTAQISVENRFQEFYAQKSAILVSKGVLKVEDGVSNGCIHDLGMQVETRLV